LREVLSVFNSSISSYFVFLVDIKTDIDEKKECSDIREFFGRFKVKLMSIWDFICIYIVEEKREEDFSLLCF
jgi:hypothetical protein